jgi:SPP1 gp7 family putative phage head morphogenesis protein
MFTLLPSDRAAVSSAILDNMVEAFVKRYEMEHSRAQKGLELGYSKLTRQISRALDLDLGDIRNTFDWFNKGLVDDSLYHVEGRVNRILHHVTSKQVPTATAVREMRRLLEDEGITEAKPTVVETLVRTQSQMAFGAAQYIMDQDDPADLIWGYTYVTVGDDRVRESHALMNGVTRPKDDPIWDLWWPPNGWNCRCQLVAILNFQDKLQVETEVPEDADPDEDFDMNLGKMLTAA